MKNIRNLVLAALLLGCGEDLTTEDLTNSERRVADARALNSGVVAEVTAFEQQREVLEREIEDLTTELGALPTIADLEANIKDAEDAVEIAKSELAPIERELQAAESRLTTFKKSSPSYERYVKEQLQAHNHHLCRDSVESAYERLGVTDASALNGLYESPSMSYASLISELELFGLKSPVGCPGFWIDGENPPTFASERQVRQALCPTVDAGVLARDPNRFKGQCLRGWGSVVQFDTNTGPCAFHANIGESQTSSWNYDYRVEFKDTGDCSWLDEVDQGSNIQWWAVADGPLSYSTTTGGSNTIPSLRIFSWRS